MFSNHLIIGWRKMVHKKIYSLIHVAGLALGLGACLVIYVIVAHEFSYDNFHPEKEKIYRVIADVTKNTGDKLHFARIPSGVTSHRYEMSGTDAVAGVIPYHARITVPGGDKAPKNFDSGLPESQFVTTALTEPAYFSIFRYQWLAGDPATALQAPNTVVLTENRGRQFFGTIPPADMVGRQIIYDDSLTATVSGVVRDWIKNTDLGFTDFISFATIPGSFLKNTMNLRSWAEPDMNVWTFVKLSQGVKPAQFNNQLNGLVKHHPPQQDKLTLWLQTLSDLHFDANIVENPVRTADKPTLYALVAIASFILMLAIINFINLSTAQSMQRAKEIGIRKMLGGQKINLMLQFLTETFMYTCMALFLAVVCIRPVLAAFHSFLPSGLMVNFSWTMAIAFAAIITVFTTLIAGLYPAKIIASYSPVLTLKGMNEQRGGDKWFLRKALIIFQFAVSLIFIICGIVMASQLKYTRDKNPGFDKDAVITMDTPGGDSASLKNVFVEKIKSLPLVEQVALQWVPPMTGKGRGHGIKFSSTDLKETGVAQVAGNENFIPLYHIQLLAGRNLFPADSLSEIVINEHLSKLMGCKTPREVLGKMIYWDGKPYPVVGVVGDFHTRSFHETIAPMCLVNRPDREGTVAIKLTPAGASPGNMKVALSQVETIWKQIYPGHSFSYQFYDESLGLLYEKDQQEAKLINTATGITIFISCMGLFGLSLFMTEKRSKEISIRKVLGASVGGITTMLCKDFIGLVVIAFVAASPVAWFFMHQWLNGFAYRVEINGWMFGMAGITVVLVSVCTIFFQTIKAARANPVKTLRTS